MIRASALLVTVICLLVLFLPGATRAQTTHKPSPTPPTQIEEIDPEDVIRVKTSLVNSPVLVIGRNGKFVPLLRRDDFEVFEDGVKQDVTYFSPVESPYTLALLIDTSRSTLFSLEEIKSSAISLVSSMRPNDRAVVITFSDELKAVTELTNDQSTLQTAILNIRPGGASRVYDAVSLALTRLSEALESRKAVVLFSDGVDNDSREATFESTLQLAQRSEALIHPIQFGTFESMRRRMRSKRQPFEGSGFSKQDYQRADSYLHQLAEISGTGVYSALNISDLDRVVASVVDELHNEYSIGYYPQTPGKPGEVRKVEIRVKQQQLSVRARSGYVVDQSGVALRTSQKTSLTLDRSAESESIPAAREIPLERAMLGSKWTCKGPGVSSDLAVVKEGFVAQCPPSTRINEDSNAWFVKRPAANETICKGFLIWNGKEVNGAPVPTGYVVTGETLTPVCSRSTKGRDLANAWTIQAASSGVTVCKGFILPRGFVVAGERASASCPKRSSGMNAWIIRPK